MTIIEESLDRLVTKIKEDMSPCDVRFVKAYKNQHTDSPIRGYLVTVALDNLHVEKDFIGGVVGDKMMGREYKASAWFKVYAPMDTNGNGLSELTAQLCSAIEKADSDKLVEDMKMSSIEYDANMRTVFRTVTLTLGFCLCEEAAI